MSPKKSPFFELRSGTVDTLLFVVKTTDLDAMRAELTRRFEATPNSSLMTWSPSTCAVSPTTSACRSPR